MSTDQTFIHATAVVEDGAQIDPSARVWHHAHVRTGAVIGRGCVVGKNVFIDGGVIVGDGSKIQNNVSVYRGVVLEAGVFVGPSVVFTNDLRPRAGSEQWEIIPTLIEAGASIGANATILCGVTIGRFAMVAAGSVVTTHVRPHEVVMGNPARHAGWICECARTITKGEAFVSEACGCNSEKM